MKNKVRVVGAIVATVALSVSVASGAHAVSGRVTSLVVPATLTSPTPDVGIWYATWYADLPTLSTNWIAGFGGSSINQFVGDVTGDGIADAVTFETGGIWKVAASTGNGFSSPSTWISGHGSGSTDQFLADVNGDGKQDAVVYFNSDVNGDGYAGDWYVALSNGTSFQPYTLWKSGAGQNATKRILADINGDGKADVVSFFSSTGTWSVALSSGSGFGAVSSWATGMGGGSDNQFVADTNDDGKADAIYFNASTGNWYVSTSSGSAYGSPSLWTSGHGSGSTTQLVTDGNGDGYAEPFAYFNADVGFPTGDSNPGDLVGREYDRSTHAITNDNEVFNTGFGYGSTKYMQGNVTGDKYGWKASVAFFAGTGGGTWAVQRYHAAASVTHNTWAGFAGKPAIAYRPLTLGSYQTYDSGNSAVIDEHISTISSAQIDYLLMDETNHLNVDSDYILDRAHDVAARLNVHNTVPTNRPLKYAFAVGGLQYTGTPITVEQEAAQTWTEFASDPTIGGSNYYEVGGKPLLVVDASTSQQAAWMSYSGDKSASNHFTIRWANYPVQAGNYGWELPPTGTVDDSDVMVAMPGWNNNAGSTPVSRNNGLFYVQNNILPIVSRSIPPAEVVINSFNEFAEETGMQVSDTSGLVSPSEKWVNTDGVADSSMYWNLTKDFVNQLKNPSKVHRSSAGFSSTQGVNGWTYQEWDTSGSTTTVNSMTWDAANTRWHGSATYGLIGSNWQHPDTNAQSVRVYTAPTAGTVTISGTVQKSESGGDGVTARIMKNGVQIWPATGGPKSLSSTSVENILTTVSVSVGDKLQFAVSAVATPNYDTTQWDPAVTYN